MFQPKVLSKKNVIYISILLCVKKMEINPLVMQKIGVNNKNMRIKL